jgi:hypothetical protein
MQGIAVFAFVAFLSLSWAWPQALLGQDRPEGWDSMRARWASGLVWKPTGLSIHTEELAQDGSILSVEDSLYVVSYPEGPDKPHSELLKVTKDGKDLTAERRAKAGKRGASASGGQPTGVNFPDPVPFSQKADARLSLAKSRNHPRGVEDLGYRIADKPAVVGSLRLSAGEPISIDYRLEGLPFYVQSFKGRTLFASLADASLVASELSFDVLADIAIIKKHYRFSLTFGSWVKVEARVASGS